jgi:hypothetical protein
MRFLPALVAASAPASAAAPASTAVLASAPASTSLGNIGDRQGIGGASPPPPSGT